MPHASSLILRPILLKKDPHGRGLHVVVLAGAHGPEEGAQEYQGYDDAAADEEIDDVHGGWFCILRNCLPQLILAGKISGTN